MAPLGSYRTVLITPTGTFSNTRTKKSAPQLFLGTHIKHYVGTDREVGVFSNQRPWMSTDVNVLLNERDCAFRSGDETQYKAAKGNFRRGIRNAQTRYKRKPEDHFNSTRTSNLTAVTRARPGCSSYSSALLNLGFS